MAGETARVGRDGGCQGRKLEISSLKQLGIGNGENGTGWFGTSAVFEFEFVGDLAFLI
jgi:hypothetical protein